jgi:hypothetical protein
VIDAVFDEATRTVTVEDDTAEYILLADGEDRTACDDNEKDTMTGASGQDLFFANLALDANDHATTKDKTTDLHADEFATDVDWVLAE